ncbi:3-oxoacyl-ACP reductase [Rugosimonospora acidiphila]|uniref:3-oxoacyl-ACP reductase n=1 Tax=Rugosimonospora acidiphila TaxID=556531 RepID=A0ABP9RG54_9ACTN
MSDRYASFAASGPGRALVKRLGLPQPPRLRRYRAGDPLLPGPVLIGGNGRLGGAIGKLLDSMAVEVRDPGEPADPNRIALNAALVFDATGITRSAGLRALYDFFHPHARSLYPCGRVVVLGTPPERCATPAEATAQRALGGFVRSVGKEFGRGTTANLVYAAPDADLESTLRFLLSDRSAYVCGQEIRVGPGPATVPADWDRPLADKVALVTGAARGIGADIARVLTRQGAHVVCLDVPAAGEALSTVANELAGTAFQLDLTAADAPARLAEHLQARHGGVDIVVHNAGITRDKTIARLTPEQWDPVLDVNLSSQERVNEALLAEDLVPRGGRLIGVASIAGIAGNRGQTNYATSKAGVIGLVQSTAPILAGSGITVNAVAPGFIETAMTARMPVFVREAGRRLNSMSQGGLPVDVAETVAYFASPASGGVTGNVVRVCGQSLLGA